MPAGVGFQNSPKIETSNAGAREEAEREKPNGMEREHDKETDVSQTSQAGDETLGGQKNK